MATLAQHVDVAFWLKAAVVGLASGVLSGMFGIGGGLVTTPAVRLLLGGSAIAAVASTLPVIIPTALTGAYSYTRSRLADPRAGVTIGAAGAVFAVLGAYLTRFIGGRALLLVTAVLIAYMAVDMTLLALRPPAEASAGDALAAGESARAQRGGAVARFAPSAAAFAALGVVAGLYSGMLGLGGGFVIVPTLTRWFGFPPKRAIGTSLVAIAILSVPATVTHALLGNIDWRIAIALSLTTIPGALVGARITRVASDRFVQLGFAALLVVAAVSLALNELGVL